jgi:hypothetical protein
MPTTVKTSAKHGSLGDLSTYSVETSAFPVDTSDSSGSIPTVSATFVDGKDVEYLIAEDFTLETPSLGKYDGDIVNVNKTAGSNRYSLEVHNIMTRLNSELRLYPLSDFSAVDSPFMPVFTLEYWTQQCGIFHCKVPGSPIFYQSQWGHMGAWARDITRPLKTSLLLASEGYASDWSGDRVMNNLPRKSEALLDFPGKTYLSDMGGYLPVLIPSKGYMVFGGTFRMTGTSRVGHVTWRMIDAKGAKRYLRVTANSSGSLSLSTSENGVNFVSRGVLSVTVGEEASYFVGVSQTATSTSFRFSAYSATTSFGTHTTTTTNSGFRGSLSLTQVVYAADDTGSGTMMLHGDEFISQMETMPTARLPFQKSITVGLKASKNMIGFSGNVWEHIKQYCSIYHLDMNYRNGKLTIEPRRRELTTGASLSALSTTVANRETARHVEVVNQQHTPTSVLPRVMWKADTVYQVAVGEVQEFTVQTPHSILNVSQPVCVSGINPFPYTSGAGQYVVTGSDGYIVSPQFWKDQGGSVTCDITENEGEIKIRIKGPDFDSSRAPYRISEGDAGRPALYITGQGLLADPVTIKIPTGNSKAAKDVGVTVDSPFIGTKLAAYNAGARAAKAFSLPEVQVTFAEPIGYDEKSALGEVPPGQLVKKDGNILRVANASQSPSMVSGSAVQHNTIYQLNRSFKTSTGTAGNIGAMNAYYGTKPIGKVNLKPIKEVK